MDIAITATSTLRNETDHDSEGILLPLSNGDVLYIYRTDPGSSGGHLSDTGKLVQRTYDVSEGTWGSITDFFSDSYDDRNVHGGVTSSGRLVVFFRRYNVGTGPVDNNFMYSDNDGSTWSSRTTLTLGDSAASPYGDMIYVPTKGYMMSFQTHYYLEVQFSSDGSSWGNAVVVGDYTTNEEFNLTEAAFTYVGDGKIIGLVRDNDSDSRDMLYQVTSSDYGATWSKPMRTNIGGETFIVSPRIIYDNGEMIVLAPDRRSEAGDGTMANEGMYIYKGDPSITFSNPTAYEYYTFIPRPDTVKDMENYGYPTYAEIDTDKYLVVYTDRHDDGTNEDTNLYQCEMTLKTTPVEGESYWFPCFRFD